MAFVEKQRLASTQNRLLRDIMMDSQMEKRMQMQDRLARAVNGSQGLFGQTDDDHAARRFTRPSFAWLSISAGGSGLAHVIGQGVYTGFESRLPMPFPRDGGK